MPSAQRPSRDLVTLIELQAGVVSREQVLGLGHGGGVLARWVRQGLFRRVTHGIYTPDREVTWLGLVWSGLLLGGSTAVVGGRAALSLHGLKIDRGDVIDIHVSDGVHRTNREHWRFIRAARANQGTPPRARLEEACLDVAQTLEDDADVISLVAEALHRGRSHERRLLKALLGRTKHRHRQLLTELCGGQLSGVRSPLERRYATIEAAHGLPAGTRQAETASGGVTDVLYEAYGCVIELDGGQHRDPGQRFRDLTRDNINSVHGLRSLRFGSRDLRSRPCDVAAQVSTLLRHAGWPGPDAITCRACL